MQENRPNGSRAAGVLRQFLTGAGFLGQGLRLWITAPRLMLIGAVPALIVAAFYVAGIVVLLMNFDTVTAWATPFADEWSEPLRTITRVVATIALLGIAVLLILYTFTAVTLAVGDPFYERIWRSVEKRLGNAPPEPEEGFWRSLGRSVGEALRLLVVTALIGVTLFVCGFVPVLGQTVVPVLGALVGGWFLTLELTGFAFTARGMTLRTRRHILGARRARTLGFGVLTYLLFLVPFGAVIVMPAAVAGATLLSRDALGTPAAPLPRP
ncbi:EI24 domain-containing protein [Planctomonas psychrotolerans]|uniref:EI24 domain-containing protein n=1 Tax=Planctomonas psychrotolerans TaxID=2528712 RepID=UPI00123995B5|nr:EI24 domain-containing protein [Planctomonas psychrotolerans]